MTKRSKFCRKCQTSKPVEDFYLRATGRREAWCKPCTIKDANGRKAEKRRLAREERAARPAPPLPTEKRCTGCQIVKPVAEFYRSQARCRECVSIYRAEWYARPGRREAVAAARTAYIERNRPAHRARRLAKYGITLEEYDARYDAQNGKCLICGSDRLRIGDGKPSGRDVLCVDHHHGSGEVRGLLCSSCNLGLGCLGEDIARLEAAIQYLQGAPNGSQQKRSAGVASGG